MKIIDNLSIYYLVIFFLLFLYVLGIFTFGFEKVLFQAAAPILATVAAGLVLDFIELKRWTKVQTPLITGLIIGLVGQFGESSLNLALIGIFSMVIKFFAKLGNRHIFNPAGAGLFLGMIFLGSYPSWWAGGGEAWPFYIWIPLFLYKFKRWAPMIGFLIPNIFSAQALLTSASTLFFLSVMLIEPKTSPASVKNGLIYGLVVGIAYILIGRFSQLDPILSSLLIGNLTARLLDMYINT